MEGGLIQTSMNLELDGKRALVTGSTAGIGYAIAEGLAREGVDVIVNGGRTSGSSKRLSRF
jgi:NAD(P)-dependent dehydrogenase (short-subunit alcohol dehydrogenase family)